MDLLMKKVVIALITISFVLGQIARIQQGNIAFTLLDLSVGIVSVSWLLGVLVKRQRIELSIQLKLLIGFLTAGLIGLLLFLPHISLLQLGISLLYPLRLLMYLALYSIVIRLNKNEKPFVAHALTFAGSAIVLLGLIQYLFYPALKNLYYLGWDDHLYRLFSTFLDPNFAGAFFALFALFILERFLESPMMVRKVSYAVIGVLSIVALLLTYSRTGFIMLLIGLGVYLFSFVSKKITLLALILCIGLFLLTANTKLEGLNPFRIASTEARLESAQIALHIIAKHPIFGVGFNAYRYAQVTMGYRSENPKFPSHSDATTDNSYLFVLATTGIIGFGFFIIFLLRFLKTLKGDADANISFAKSLFAGIMSILVGSFFINALFYPMLLGWLAVHAGLVSIRKN